LRLLKRQSLKTPDRDYTATPLGSMLCNNVVNWLH
jgi:hypothetical protein